MNKIISVITINYNNYIGLKKTIDSVLSQKNASFEYLVIDGGSTDSSLDIIKENIKQVDYFISERDNGIYNAMNKGIKQATGDYLIFLNSGDFFNNNYVLEKCIKAIEIDNSIDIWYGDMLVNNRVGYAPYVHKHPSNLSLKHFKHDTINHQSTVIKHDLFFEFGLYPENYKLASDYWLFLLSLIKDKKYKYLGFELTVYDFTGMSAMDEFKSYKNEQHFIWSTLVPKYVDQILHDNDKLLQKIADNKVLMNYKIIKSSIKIHKLLQGIKFKYFRKT